MFTGDLVCAVRSSWGCIHPLPIQFLQIFVGKNLWWWPPACSTVGLLRAGPDPWLRKLHIIRICLWSSVIEQCSHNARLAFCITRFLPWNIESWPNLGKNQRIRKRYKKKVKKENEDEPMAEALPPMDDAELMDFVSQVARTRSIQTGVCLPVANQLVPRTEE